MEAPLALYRRYRPETFAEVIGQEHVTEPLRAALANNRVNHAYLFSGPRGCGKTTSARILARALNCEKAPAPDPCGECDSCRELARGGPGSIDVIEIDAASHGGVDDARDLREKAFFAPVKSRYKVYIIDEAHMVSPQGFNALLKLVEEPPPHLRFIFATTEPEKVLPTIRSRTHHYPFRLIPPKLLSNYLSDLCSREGVAIEPAALPLVVRAGGGSARDTLSVLDQLLGGASTDGVTHALATGLLGYTPDSLLDEIVDAFAAADGAGVFGVIDKVIETGQDPRRFTEDLLRRLRDLVIVAAVPDASVTGLIDVPADAAERLTAQANRFGVAALTRAADLFASGLTEMRGATAPRLLLELVCSRVLLPSADDSTAGLGARLDRLERRLAMTGEALQTAPQEYAAPQPSAPVPEAGPAAARQAAAAARTQQPAPTVPVAATSQAPAPEQRSAPSSSQPPPWDVEPQTPVVSQTPAARQVAPEPPSVPEPPTPAASAQATAPSHSDWVPPAEPPEWDTPSESDDWQPMEPAAPAASTAQSPSQPHAVAGPASEANRPTAAAAASEPLSSGYAAPSQPATGAPAPAAAPEAAASPGMSLADVRRLWPDIVEATKSRRRVTWIHLTQNAQVVAVDTKSLTLGFANPGARDSFANGGSDEVVRQAAIDVVGQDWRIEAIVDPGARAGEPAPVTLNPAVRPAADPPPPPSAAPLTSSAPETAPDWARNDTRSETVQPTGAGQPNAQQPTADAASAARAAIAPIRSGEGPAGARQTPDVDIDADAAADDPTMDDAGLDGKALIERTLGGTVIEEIRHD